MKISCVCVRAALGNTEAQNFHFGNEESEKRDQEFLETKPCYGMAAIPKEHARKEARKENKKSEGIAEEEQGESSARSRAESSGDVVENATHCASTKARKGMWLFSASLNNAMYAPGGAARYVPCWQRCCPPRSWGQRRGFMQYHSDEVTYLYMSPDRAATSEASLDARVLRMSISRRPISEIRNLHCTRLFLWTFLIAENIL